MRVCVVAIEAEQRRVDGSRGVPAPVSGMGEVIRLTAQLLHANHHEVIAAIPPAPSLRSVLAPMCTTIVDLVPPSRRSSFGRNALPLLRMVRRHRPDIVHFHVPHYRWGLDAVAAAHLARGSRVVRTEHNPMMMPPELPYRWLLRVADAAVDRFVYVSAGNRRRFEELMPWRSRGVVLMNVVDPDRLDRSALLAPAGAMPSAVDGRAPGTRSAVFVAGSWQLDGHEGRRPIGPILEAMAQVPPYWHLFVAGEGDVSRAREVARRFELAERVHFLGPVPEASRLIASCDLLVSASHFEGLSVSYLEAWYAGVPVLSTPVDGIEDVIGAEQQSKITAPHDDTAGFAARWRQADVEGSPFRQANATATQRVRTTFLPGDYAEALLALYDEVLG